ncbi:MAG: hypothetical protein EHM13_02070 [Acidobacteria bacterium]|nr:MAG: hypothetical protein EHM13_02070 [Acidobacteriota bacterium]
MEDAQPQLQTAAGPADRPIRFADILPATPSIDAATLRDLEVLSTTSRGGTTLLALVDRTRSRVGQRCLRQFLQAPATSAEEILARQQAHRAIASAAERYRRILDGADTDGTERYLSSNWQLPTEHPGVVQVGAVAFRFGWRKAYLSDVAGGQARVASLLGAAMELRANLDAGLLQRLRDVFEAILEAPDVQELTRLSTRTSAGGRTAFDQLARGEGKSQLDELVAAVGTVEAMWSLAVDTEEHGWSYPRPSSHFIADALYHPFLGANSVANNVNCDDHVHVCFITGPNMAGKSTFLKAVALSMLLAHVGAGVPAKSLEFPPVGTIFSSVNVSESLSAGESFYLAEVRRIRALALALQRGSAFAILDEPLRGTNVYDATEATIAITTRLAARNDVLVLIASHLAEVVPAMTDDRRVLLLHFAADTSGEQPRFDYRLRDGMSAQRLGMTLLRQEQVLALLGDV